MIKTILLTNISLLLFISQLLIFYFPRIGLYADVGTLIFLIIFALYDIYDFYAEEVLALSSTIPLLTLVGFILPLSHFIQYSLAIHVGLLITSLFYEYFLIKNTFKTIDLFSFIIALSGGLSFIGIALYSYIPGYPFTGDIVGSIIVFYGVAAEEFFFRGLLFTEARKLTNILPAVLFSSLLFMLFHFNGNLLHNCFFFLFGIALSLIYSYKRNIYACVFMHTFVLLAFFLVTKTILI